MERNRRGSVIVVDDEKSVREIISRALERHGFNVVTAGDGFDALEKVSQAHFDLMFLDIKMPEMSGLDLLSIMCTYHPATTVVMVTGVDSPQSRHEV